MVLLDALGTLVELPPPAPALVEELAARGVAVTEEEASRAIGAEIAYYRAHLDEASDATGLEALRGRCTEVLRDALPPHARGIVDLQEALLGALRFRAYPEAAATLAELRSRGATLVVVSNWDVSLHEVLDRTGLAPFVDAVLTSAEHGAAKPDPSIFAAAVERVGAGPQDAVHVGDSPEADVAGARAAGIEPVLIVRDGTPAPTDGTRTITTLSSLVGTLSLSPTWDIQPERPAPPPPRTEDNWLPWSALVALVAAMFLGFLGQALVLLGAAAFGLDYKASDPPPGLTLPAGVLLQAAFIAAAIGFGRLAGPVTPASYGLRRPPKGIWRAIGLIVAVFFGYIVLAGIYTQLVDLEGAEDQLEGLGIEKQAVAIAFGALVVCVAAPIGEELFFRGFMYRALRNWRGVIPAALLTGTIFGLIHGLSAEALALPPLAVLGVAFCLLYQWTGSLYVCMALHAINKSIAYGAAVDWDWQIPLLLLGSLATIAAIVMPIAAHWRARAASTAGNSNTIAPLTS